MYTIKIVNLRQAADVREFLEKRAGMVFNKDFTVVFGDDVEVPAGMPYGEQVMWKFID